MLKRMLVVMLAAVVMVGSARGGSNGVTREDLGRAYIAFELAMLKHPPAKDAIAKVNRQFDQITRMFFGQDLDEAIRELNQVTLRMSREDAPTNADYALASLRAEVSPRYWSLDSTGELPVVRVSSVYDLPQTQEGMVRITVAVAMAGAAEPVYHFEFDADLGPEKLISVEFPLDESARKLLPTRYDITLSAEGGAVLTTMPWFVMARSPESARAWIEDQLSIISDTDSPLARAVRIARSRASLLVNEPSRERSAQFLTDPVMLATELGIEVRKLDEAVNPYKNREGHWWRTLELDDGRVCPMRVYAPRVVRRATPLPLVIALHGAGADENMFMTGYGAGALARLAEDRGFVAVSPSTLILGSDAEVFDRLVDDVCEDYRIDRSRVYVLGHSLGAVATAGLASARPGAIAAAACIAGFRDIPADPAPAPLLLVAAELDKIFPLARLIEQTAALSERGVLEVIRYPDHGHTLIVGDALPEVIKWLMSKRLATVPE